jgi:type I restriction enzyme, R subunit
MALSEAKTRAERINPQLIAANWDITNRTQVRFEVPVIGYDPTPWNGFTDYSLYEPSGNVIAVIEAKKSARSPREGEEQLRQYVAEIAKKQPYAPFGFMANGLQTFFWEVGLEHPREGAGFFSPSDLSRLNFIRQNRQPLDSLAISNSIVDRPYQHEAIRRVAEAFNAGRRRALVVMATGTGKTRVAMGLIDLLMRGYWAQKVLFLADRDGLVEQALSEGFKAYLPSEPRVRIHSAAIDPDKRLYVATLQTMGRCFDQFSPAFFDLIIFDEAHRSIFNRFTEVIEYFDARMIGLTATPAAFIDRDTFRTFDCEGQLPTFLYPYQQAIDEKQLVDFRVFQAQTGFQRKGIKGVDLSEEDRNSLIEAGIDPDSVDFSGTDLEILVSNKDTLRRQWEEIMDVCIKDRAGNLPGKTIIFAMTKAHGERLREVFEEMFPRHVGVLQVIYDGVERVHDGAYGDGLISTFKKKDLPRIAISVDMLDTGINVPEVVNLVFMKPVQSRIKLWQMIGRGTRNQEACKYFDRLPNGEKTEFKIIDFWQNDFGRQTDNYIPMDMPVLVRLFNTRLDIMAATRTDPTSFAYRQALADCRAMLARIPTESYPVRKGWAGIEAAWTEPFWLYTGDSQYSFLRLKVAPLLRYVPDVDVYAETFAHKSERLKLQSLQGKPSVELLQSIAEDVSRLPGYVHADPSRQESIRLALSNQLAQASPEAISLLIKDLAGEMKNKRQSASVLKIDLPDFIAGKGYILIGPAGESVQVEEYRKRVEDRVLAIAEHHPALVAIRDGRQPAEDQLVDLERQLENGLTAGQVQLTSKTAWEAYGLRLNNRLGFLGLARHVLALDGIPDYETVVRHDFDEHAVRNNYSADQIRFIRAVQEVFISKKRISQADLYEPPLTTFGRNAVERYFDPEQIKQIVVLAEHLAA